MSKNIFKRFTLVENYPLYAMLGVAGFLAIYTPLKHLSTDNELISDPSKRQKNAECENIVPNNNEYMGGIYGWVHKKYVPFIKNDKLNQHRYD
jgi:hypothetical protein